MNPIGDIKYRVECFACGAQFLVNDIRDELPRHPRKGDQTPHDSYIPCIGSGYEGRLIGTEIENESA